MCQNILPLIPKHTVYVEPFCGGASVLFAKPFPSVRNADLYREIINDLDGLLINFYRQLQSGNEELLRRLEYTLYSREEHNKAREICSNPEKYSDIEKAWAYFVSMQQGFGSGFQCSWGYNVLGANLVHTWRNRIKRLSETVERLKSVQIEHDDALKIIKRFDSPHTFFYCDPPYINTYQDSYQHKFKVEDLLILVQTLSTVQGSFILSGYETDIVIPTDWEVLKFNTTCSSAYDKNIVNKKRIEVVWRKINTLNIHPKIQKLYDSGMYDCYTGGF